MNCEADNYCLPQSYLQQKQLQQQPPPQQQEITQSLFVIKKIQNYESQLIRSFLVLGPERRDPKYVATWCINTERLNLEQPGTTEMSCSVSTVQSTRAPSIILLYCYNAYINDFLLPKCFWKYLRTLYYSIMLLRHKVWYRAILSNATAQSLKDKRLIIIQVYNLCCLILR